MDDLFYIFNWFPNLQFKLLVNIFKVASMTIVLMTVTVNLYSFYIPEITGHNGILQIVRYLCMLQ